MSTTLTAQNIIDGTSQDIRAQLAASWGDADILLDYVNRVCLNVLRRSQWNFLLAPVQRFITELHQTDYWIGASGSNPQGAVDTGLNLTNVGRLKVDSVFDRSNWLPLGRTGEPPLSARFTFQDVAGRPGRPRLWRQSYDTSNIINIYPPSDNQNLYYEVPPAPNIETTVSGALAARIYFVKTTFVDSAGGESTASTTAARQFIPANSLAKIKSPSPTFSKSTSGVTYNQYNVYASTTEGSEQKQNASPIAIGTDWTEPGTGLIAGAAPPTASTLEPLRGYIIEFRYYKTRAQVTTADQVLQIPDDYKDVLIAGVNYFAYLYLRRPEEAQIWLTIYLDGLQAMIRDKKLFPQGGEFVRPDQATTGGRIAIETLDPSITNLYGE